MPELAIVDSALWDEAFALTASRRYAPARDELGCGDKYPVLSRPDEVDDGVEILRQTTIGAFLLTTIRSTNPDSLATWLTAHDFTVVPEDVERLRPIAERGWVFSLMRLNRQAVDLPDAWDVSVDPVSFTFAASTLEVPLTVLAINRSSRLPMSFFVIDAHRMALPGFQTTYANSITSDEHAAIRTRFPTLAGDLPPGVFLTRMDRVFEAPDPMDESILLGRAPSDDEFRRQSSWATAAGAWGIPVLVLLITGLRVLLRSATARPNVA